MRETAIVITYNAIRGFGFARSDKTDEDVFIFVGNINRKLFESGCTCFFAGNVIEFSVTEGEKGPIAKNIVLLGAVPSHQIPKIRRVMKNAK